MAFVNAMESATMQKFRFHVVGLPHTQVTKEFLPCAYTQKVLNFCKMMKSLGHEVFLYAGGSQTDVEVDEFISVISEEKQKEFFGHTDWKVDFFPIEWDEKLPYWQIANNNAASEIKKRFKPKDFICLIGGVCQKPIADQFQGQIFVEFGVGYQGIFSNYKVFESYAWMHYCYGLQGFKNGQNYDCVIPNYFDVKDFPFSEKKEDYYLYIGRMITRKGAHIAAEATGLAGAKLIMAGQGILSRENGVLKAKELELSGDHITHVGTVGLKERGELMSKAKAVFVQTQYIGPFEGVSIEANLCGTPVITTDWGCFAENVVDGLNGFRTRTMGEILWAMKEVEKMDFAKIREYAIANFSLDRVKQLYQAYFEQLYQLWDKGWYNTSYDPSNQRYRRFI